MRIKKIYKFETEEEIEYIFIVEGGRKVIKRSNQKIQKLNLKKWEVISFIPERFYELDREATDKEVKEVKKFLKNDKKTKNNSFWHKIKNIFN
ncbi:MAG: hypothetical protein ACQEQD_08075 [Bacillota bacterium]